MKHEQAIGAVQAYIVGVARQDAEALRKLFAPTAHIVGMDEATYSAVPRDRWIDFVTAPERKGAGLEAFEIQGMTLHGSAGAVVVKTRFGAFDYTDILSLLLVDGSVRVVAKTYYQNPQPL
ncbi:nuclear transport factor 2 family protein [Mesorhizobium sp. A623]